MNFPERWTQITYLAQINPRKTRESIKNEAARSWWKVKVNIAFRIIDVIDVRHQKSRMVSLVHNHVIFYSHARAHCRKRRKNLETKGHYGFDETDYKISLSDLVRLMTTMNGTFFGITYVTLKTHWDERKTRTWWFDRWMLFKSQCRIHTLR